MQLLDSINRHKKYYLQCTEAPTVNRGVDTRLGPTSNSVSDTQHSFSQAGGILASFVTLGGVRSQVEAGIQSRFQFFLCRRFGNLACGELAGLKNVFAPDLFMDELAFEHGETL